MPRSIWSESLSSFSDSVAATRPAPAGVAAAAVAAELGISLMIKAMSITGGQDELVDAARQESAHLRGAADDDVGAVMEFMQARDAAARRQAIEAPMRARARRRRRPGTMREGFRRGEAMPWRWIQLAAQALLAGALRAILLCIDANLQGREDEYPRRGRRAPGD